MKRLMTALGLAAAISLFSVSPSSAAPTPVQQLKRMALEKQKPDPHSRFPGPAVPSHNETLVEEQ